MSSELSQLLSGLMHSNDFELYSVWPNKDDVLLWERGITTFPTSYAIWDNI